MKTLIIYISIIFLFAITATSCQKVIEVDLNSADPKLVIEGRITDSAGPYAVKLSQTANYFDVNEFPAVTGAFVVISDNEGIADTLTESALPGTYITNKLQGTAGKTYTLQVNAKGENYTAISYLPNRVEIDSVITYKPEGINFGRDRRAGWQFVRLFFKDPAGQGNYYRIKMYKNDTLADFNGNYLIYQDNIQDGNVVDAGLFGEFVYPGDSVNLELHSIDKAAFDYYTGLNQLAPRGGGSSAAPANPPTNVNNGAVGFFSAFSVSRRNLIIK